MDTTSTLPAAAAAQQGTATCPVADVMRRVHEQLRGGAAPSFEALLALGEPTARRPAVSGTVLAR